MRVTVDTLSDLEDVTVASMPNEIHTENKNKKRTKHSWVWGDSSSPVYM